MNKNRKWQITLTEEQLAFMANIIDDWHRFICGDCRLHNATSYIESCETMHQVRDILDKDVKHEMFPELTYGENYSWNGGHKNPHLNEAQAMSYMLYREMRHQLALANSKGLCNVYLSETLTCPAQGPMIKVELLK